MAGDNLVKGYTFDGASGIKTGANLEDLVTLARFTSNAFDGDASSLFDGTTIAADGNGNAYVPDAAITAAKLGTNAVETAKIKDANVTEAKIADGAVTVNKIPDSSITAAKLAAGAATLTGEIKIWSTNSAPSGWVECDGSELNRTTYADLYAVIGDTFGEGNGSTTFNVPDFRGRFLRGWDNTAGNDPDAASRTAMNTGGNTGDNIGSVQEDAFKSHSHTYNVGSTSSGSNPLQTENTTGTRSTNSTGGNETRPKNAYVMFIIKT